MIKPYKRHDVLIDFNTIENNCWIEYLQQIQKQEPQINVVLPQQEDEKGE